MKHSALLHIRERDIRLGKILSVIVFGMLLTQANAAHSAPTTMLIVNSASDMPIAGDGECTLREAITNANDNSDTTNGDCLAGSGEDTITFSLSTPVTITLNSQFPNISSGSVITITGPGPTATALVISGNNNVRILQVDDGGSLTINTVTIAYGRISGADGGGLFNNGGTVAIINSSIANNNVLGFTPGGGAIYNAGVLSITNSSLINNSSAASGGGIFNANSGSLTAIDSTFSGNSASGGNGGGINNSGWVSITNSTIAGNSATGGGVAYRISMCYRPQTTPYLAIAALLEGVSTITVS